MNFFMLVVFLFVFQSWVVSIFLVYVCMQKDPNTIQVIFKYWQCLFERQYKKNGAICCWYGYRPFGSYFLSVLPQVTVVQIV